MRCSIAVLLTFLLAAVAADRRPSRATADDGWVAIERGDAERLRGMLGRGLDPDASCGSMTLLMHAAAEGRSACVAALLAAGADVELTTDAGATALTCAAHTGDAASVRRLLEAGADPNARMAHGATPLMFAAMSGDAERVAAILSAGGDRHARTDAGTTAAACAAIYGHTGLTHLLGEVESETARADAARPVAPPEAGPGASAAAADR